MRYSLSLYVTGRTAQSQGAIFNLRSVLESALQNEYDLEVIDVLEYSDLAERDKILATPTLVKRRPEPMRKIIGDLSDREKVLRSLDVMFYADDSADHPPGTEK